MAHTTLERRLLAARPDTDDGELRLEAMVASRLFGPSQAGPARIGRFTLLGRIGRGGMGDVYAAYDPALDRKVALKVLRGDAGLLGAEERGSLLAEARAAARLAHPNVVSIHEVGDDGEGVHIAMEFIDGVTLRAWLRERRSLASVLHVFVQVGRGLAAAHEAGVVHRDFKPKYRRPSQTAPQPTDRPHSRELGRFERVSLLRLAPRYPALPQILAKLWQRAASWLTPYRGSTSKRQLDPGSASVRHTCLRPPRPTVSLAVPFEKYRLDMARRYRRERRR